MSGFSWYSGSSSQPEQMFNQQPDQYKQVPFVNPPLDHSYDPSHERFDEHLPPLSQNQPFYDGSSPSHPQQVHDFVLPRSSEGNNIYIHADNVIIQNGEEHGAVPIPINRGDVHNSSELKSGAINEVKTTHQDHVSTSDSNPIGVPAVHTEKSADVHPPSHTSQQATTTVAPPSSSNAMTQPTLGSAGDKEVPPLSTDKSHTSTMPSSDIPPATGPSPLSSSTVPSSTAPSSSSTIPPPSTTSVQMSANDHPPVGAKPEKKHRSMKDRYREFKMKLHGGGTSISGDVHPKDSRDGKTLPSQNELSQRQVTEPSGNSAEHPVIHKDANDATGKSVTGSDANPSKASMPFKVPAPSMNHAPVDAKAQ